MNLNDEEIIKVFNEYIKNPKMKYAILLDGDWGSGKTYFINHKFVKDNKNIIYISLYGIRTREDIDKKIYYKILANNMSSKIVKSKKVQKGLKIVKETSTAIFSITNELIKKAFNIDVSGIKNIDASEIISLFKNISDYIIVFDDLERCEIPVNEILGYINEYVEHRNVKCIIIANEHEINKANFYNNYELKLISCLKDNVDYEDDKEMDLSTICTGREKTDKINIKKLKARVENIYEENKKYKAIKEKLIGITLKYIPNISEIYDELINEYKTENNSLYDFLVKGKEKCMDILNLNKCNNIRTIIFILDRFEKLYNSIKNEKIEKEELIIELVFENVIFSSIAFKNGMDVKLLLSGCMCSSAVALKDDLRQSTKNYFTAFDFVNNYIDTGNIDKGQMIKTIDYYFKLNYEKIKMDDPYNKLKVYWELEEDEIRESLKEILENIKNNKYNYQLFPNIINSLSYIENLNFEIEKIQEIIQEMCNYIEVNEIGYIDFHNFVRDEQVGKIYNKNIKQIKDKIENKGIRDNRNSLNEILESQDWGIKLKEYIKKQNYLNRKQFLKEIDIDVIVEKIKNSNAKNIYYFKYCIDEVYGFSNLKDYFIDDLEKIKELTKKLEEINKESFGITKKEAIEYLIETLNSKGKILEE